MDIEEAALAVPSEAPAAFLSLIDNRSENQSQQLLPVWDREIFKIGRDPRSNTLAIDNDPDFNVSRNHCEVYVVIYEPTIKFIYVRDRKSSNGTYVNGEIIGKGPQISPGYLVQNGDVIEIRPHWSFVVVETRPPPRQELDNLQVEECKLFSDRYLLTNRCLGQGAEATVHLAVDVVTKKQLVCKLVNLDRLYGKSTRREIRQKFQEADILRQLRHPNILPYVDTITSPHTLYTFTELASGGDLMSFIYRQDTVEEFDCRIIVRQVVCGLGYLHDKGIVHRDLKPENILLAYSPKLAYHRVMLADFGNSAVPKRSRMVTNVGTLNYKAPEFLMDTPAHTSAVDIWSLGIITFLVLASGSSVTIQNINRMSQAEIGGHLKTAFDQIGNKPSRNGKTFVWGCLQTAPTLRMTACDAACHEWLCAPRDHLEFFQRLDTRMILDWDPHCELKPMPWELPSLKTSPLGLANDEELRCSQYFANVADLPRTSSSFEYMSRSTEKYGVSGSVEECPKTKMDTAAGNLQQEEPEKQAQTPCTDFTKPRHPTHTKNRTTYKNLPKVRVRGDALLPLTGLNSHLKPPSNPRHRQQVLQELKRSNKKFLIETIPVTPETPLNAANHKLALEPPKRQRHDRRVMLDLSDRKRVSRIKLN